ncbi:RHS repeat-associated core domain-containing protein [Maribacter dokdonensis]|uniref:RHS repeat-associated core domain-containing protein n=1 Tax=Maribacter dokdonensis TaxID=320912 RepID=UPI001B2D3131|nr:RHS repeat-associated core domain-containing protein [Maribacter dokdonensis]CAG2532857.1 RHS repeat-associated core domain-containing protein [Maribacter dokdonensis]
MDRIHNIIRILIIGLTLTISWQGNAQGGCYAAGTNLSFTATPSSSQSSSIQGGCYDGSSFDWQVGTKPSWLSAYRSGSSVLVTVSNNTTGLSRSGSVQLVKNGSQIGTFTVSQAAGAPAAPPMPSKVNYCGYTRLTRTNPPTGSGITYYWQTTSNGTNITNNTSTYVDRYSGTTYYLRAKNSSGWSPATQVTYSVNYKPGVPPNPTVDSETCTSVTLKRSMQDVYLESGYTYYWQSEANGVIANSNNSEYLTLYRSSVGNSFTYYLRARNDSSLCWSDTSASVTYTFETVSQPAAPTVAQNCGNTVLTKPGNITGYSYYWQDTAVGQSTSSANSQQSRTFTSSGTIYLRTRSDSGCWSTARTVTYSVIQLPDAPPIPSVNDSNCGEVILTRANPPANHTYFWQINATGTDDSAGNSSSTKTVTNSGSYYLRSRNNNTMCWSPATQVTYTVKYKPSKPIDPWVESENCNSVTLKRQAPDIYTTTDYTWYWQDTAAGTSILNSSETLTLYRVDVGDSFTYYLRAQYDNGCWSDQSASVTYTFETVSQPAAPTVVQNCGNTVLTKPGNITGYSYYWQDTAVGQNTLGPNSQQSRTFTSSGTIYLRTRSDSGCWSTARTVTYSVIQLPDAPPEPSVNDNNCGEVILTRANPPADHTYFWQANAIDTDDSPTNSASTKILEFGTKYYLRSRNNNTMCWSDATEVTYTIKYIPSKPIDPWVESENCNSVTVKRQAPDIYTTTDYTWYWQDTAAGTSILNSSETLTLYRVDVGDSFTYYLRAQYDNGCWSDQSASVTYTFDEMPIWYLDADNDGYAISTVQQCTSPGSGYGTTVKPLGDCDDDDATVNPDTIWYTDSDNDGYKDPDWQELQQCQKPAGNWTSDPQPVPDYCPNYFNDDDGTNGCNPTCLDGVSVTNQIVEYPSSGGNSEVVVYNFPNCGSGYSIDIQDYSAYSDWLQIVETSPNTFNVICQPGTEAKDVLVNVTVNGNSASATGGFGITVRRGAPPVNPNPDPCVAEDIPNITFSPFTDTRTVTVNYSGDCPSGTIVLRHPYDETANFEGWLSIMPQGSGVFTLSVNDNTTGSSHDTLLAPMIEIYDNGTYTYVGMGVYFLVIQPTCNTAWYPDSDGDGKGDVYGSPEIGCVAPDFGDGITWVPNNDDLCPYDPAPSYSNGCPDGIAPENWNTITTKSFDVSLTLKAAGKSYYDDMGKPVQSQSWDIRTNDIWASETKYNEEGRAALQTLSAPIRAGNNFEYKDGFVQQVDNISEFNRSNFSGAYSENPNIVGNATVGSLGWYYSDNNNRELYQDITTRPYVSSIYSTLNPGAVLRSVGGNKMDTNKNGQIDDDGLIGDDTWVHSYTYSMRASTELSTAEAFGETATEYDGRKIFKTVARDVRDFENVIFTDSDGQTLAAARSGAEGPTESHAIAINEQGYVDIHVPQGSGMGFTVSGAAAYTVYDLITEGTVTASTSLPNGFYRVAVNNADTYVPGTLSVNYQTNYYDYSLNIYDEVGRLKSSFQPLADADGDKLETKYRYNTLGQLVYTQSPDEGDAWFLYREDGQIRFSINSLQWKNGQFSYTNYDSKGRPVESGVYTDVSGYLGTYVTSDNVTELTDPFNQSLKDLIDVLDGMTDANCSEVQKTVYDAFVDSNEDGIPDDMVSSLPATIVNTYKPTFLSGNVYKTTNDNATTWYGYDIYGRVKWLVQDIGILGAKTIDYVYNPITGLVEYVHYQKGEIDEFIHWYTYDESNQLSMVRTAVDMQGPWETQAEYTYYETGELKRTELAGGVQGLDYVYSLDGKLKSLNHPTLSPAEDPNADANDLFGMQLDYHVGDYMRTSNTNIGQSQYGTDKLNGNIKSIRWKNAGPYGGSEPSEYVYEYDRNNWLKSADFDPGSVGGNVATTLPLSGTITGDHTASESITVTEGTIVPESHLYISNGGNGDYDVTGITYDVNGNIRNLVRNGQGAMDNLTYKYRTRENDPSLTRDYPNQLLRVEDTVDDNMVANADIDNQTGNNYEYNEIGQLVYDNSEQITYIYNTSGLVAEVKKGPYTVVKFQYNDRNHRIRKESFSPQNGFFVQNTYYVRDVSGQVMAIYNDFGGSMTLKEQPIYGAGRIGVSYVSSSEVENRTNVYEMTDHLGNVRAVFTKSETNANLEGVTDYFPFGMPMLGRDMTGANKYRYAYQGQEKDTETGKEAFELRLWDARIGRWLTTDPYGQYASPYLGMGNNPIGLIDRNGGYADPPNDHDYSNGFIWTDDDGSWAWNSENGIWEGIGGSDDIFGFTQVLDEVYLGSYQQWHEDYIKPQWDFVNEMIRRDHISSIHAATGEAAEWISMILPMPIPGGGATLKGLKTANNVRKMNRIRRMGKAAEKSVAEAQGFLKQHAQRRIESITGTATYRVADFLTPLAVHEVKNVSKLGLTNQIKDLLLFSMQSGRHLTIHTRKATKISPQLQKLIDNQVITHKIIGQ